MGREVARTERCATDNGPGLDADEVPAARSAEPGTEITTIEEHFPTMSQSHRAGRKQQ